MARFSGNSCASGLHGQCKGMVNCVSSRVRQQVSADWEGGGSVGGAAQFRWPARGGPGMFNHRLILQNGFRAMNSKRTAISIALAAGIAAAPLSAARAQTPYYNPLFWPFLAAGAVLGTAALIVTAPIRVVCSDCLPPPYAYYPFYVGPPVPPYAPQPVTYSAPAYPPAPGYPAGQPPITYSAPPPAG